MLGTLFVIAAPSGAGKTSLVNALRQQQPDIALSISHTTRPPRPSEQPGVHYHFVDEAAFLAAVERQEFLEYARVHGQLYGTHRQTVINHLHQGRDLILEIDWQGAAQIRAQFPTVIGIFILPPSREALAQRLAQRGQDAPTVIAQRLANAVEEMRHCEEFDYLVVNAVFDQALAELAAIFTANRLRCRRQLVQQNQLLAALRA